MRTRIKPKLVSTSRLSCLTRWDEKVQILSIKSKSDIAKDRLNQMFNQ